MERVNLEGGFEGRENNGAEKEFQAQEIIRPGMEMVLVSQHRKSLYRKRTCSNGDRLTAGTVSQPHLLSIKLKC